MKSVDVINEIKDVARATLPHGASLMLFGSRARDAARDDSDWDLLILIDKQRLTKADYDEISFPFTMLGWQINEEINPIIYTRSEWEKYRFLPFYKNVEREKIILS